MLNIAYYDAPIRDFINPKRDLFVWISITR
jgi:hypothetical protein